MKKKIKLVVICIVVVALVAFAIFWLVSIPSAGKEFEEDGVKYRLAEIVYSDGKYKTLEIVDPGDKTEITLPTKCGNTVIERFNGSHNVKDSFPNITKITIPEGYKILDLRACRGLENLETLILPNSLEEIKDYALIGSHRLRSVTLPSTIKEVGHNAVGDDSNYISVLELYYSGPEEFYVSGCEVLSKPELTRMTTYEDFQVYFEPGYGSFEIFGYTGSSMFPTLPSEEEIAELCGITRGEVYGRISPYAFKNCESIEEIVIPECYIFVGSGAFFGCTSLKSIVYNGEENVIIKTDNNNEPIPMFDNGVTVPITKSEEDQY